MLFGSLSFPARAESFTVIMLPDTQMYSLAYPQVLESQIDWVLRERAARNIRLVLNGGDIVNNNSHPEWQRAHMAYARLADAGIPFVPTTGNHDFGPWGSTADRSTLLNEYFVPRDFRNSSEWETFEPGRAENSWHGIATPWGKFLVVSLEIAPRDEVVAWADKIVAEHPNHRAIMVTHAYLYHDDTRYDWAAKGAAQEGSPSEMGVAKLAPVNDGEQLWEKLVSRHRSFFLTINGHVLGDGTGRLASKGVHGNTVWQLLSNYQTGVEPDRKNGGGGYLRIMEFQDDGMTIRVSTYSPFYDNWLREHDQEFTINTDGRCTAGVPPKPC